MMRGWLVAVVLVGLSGVWARPVAAQGEGGAAAQTFEEFLEAIRAEAAAAGITQQTIDGALTGLTPEPVVVSRDRTQPEIVQSLEAYLARRLTSSTVTAARRHARQHARLLARVERDYGVSSRVLVAIWGLESNFGRFTGTYSTVRALATLAWDGRRTLFRSELIEALRMIDRGVPPARMKGSWAGAMGQPQFMPSSYLRHAVDVDGDGVADIWTSHADVFGSMANYLRNAGWTAGERWGREVSIGRDVMARIDREVPMRTEGCRAVRLMTEARPLAEWQRLGVRLPGGGALPTADMEASLVRGERRSFLVYRNYLALLDYNCSHSYALAVGLLSDRID
jgi:membrane-bound lytic murein transglycosylase B|nr:MAG: lytic murein transglycosylase [Acidobacteriota bacterium]